jgi:Rad3-related DNA helicase
MDYQSPADLHMPGKFKDWRPGQWSIIDRVCQGLRESENFLLEAPTGTGKSIIGVAASKIIIPEDEILSRLSGNDDFRPRTIYLTVNKSLQEQVCREFPFAKSIKGRSNYPCNKHPDRFPELTAEECTKEQEPANQPRLFNGLPVNVCGDCAYKKAKQEAIRAPVAVLNTAYYLNEINGPGQFSDCDLLIVDEIDSLEKELLNHLGVPISTKTLKRFGLEPAKDPTTVRGWMEWMRDIVTGLSVKADQEEIDIGGIPETTWGTVELRRFKNVTAIRRFLHKIDYFASHVNQCPWVVDESTLNDETTWTVKPVLVKGQTPDLLWRHARKVLGMSGTILDPNLMAQDVGLDQPGYLTVPCPFPVANRPIYYLPTADMSYKRMYDELPIMLAKITELINKYPDKKVLVHAVSYKVCDYLMNNLPMKDRLITHRSADRASQLMEFKESPLPLVMVSPSFDRGVDLPGDQCRAIIIAKMPYPSLADKQISARMELADGNAWYSTRTVQTLVQMSGRGVRSETDYCDCVNPEAKVLTNDLRWVMAGDLKQGDKLLAFDELVKRVPEHRHLMRRWRSAEVVATNIKILPRWQITLETGEVLYSTPNHKWIAEEGQYVNHRWIRTDQLKIGHHLMRYTEPWDIPNYQDFYAVGWLAGFFDGEGCITLNQGQGHRNCPRIQASQNPGIVLEQAVTFLNHLGFSIKVADHQECTQVILKGGFPEILRFLGQIRPVRLLDKLVKADWGQAFQAIHSVRIVDIKQVEDGPMVTLQSSSETYLVDGFGAHNTYILDKQFEKLWSRAGKLFPTWWTAAIQKTVTKPTQARLISA